jgi:hypothetical protein
MNAQYKYKVITKFNPRKINIYLRLIDYYHIITRSNYHLFTTKSHHKL